MNKFNGFTGMIVRFKRGKKRFKLMERNKVFSKEGRIKNGGESNTL